MYRAAENHLNKWLKRKRRKPLVLRGARQVGKSTLVRQFASKNRLNLNEINLERHLYLNDIFKTLDIGSIIKELDAAIGANIQQQGSLLFLDEIQATPYALQALRYFYEDKPRLPVIAAGSLLEFALADHHFSMPVGRIEYYHLGPMSFKEFLNAIEPELLKYVSTFTIQENIPGSAHQMLLKRQREYLFTGGMPESVLVYKESESFEEVSNILRSIAGTYQDDFSKYAKQKDLVLMQRVFGHIPKSIGKKIKYSNISREQRSKDLKAIIELLTKARICHKIYHSHCSGIPLYADIDEKTYKMIFMDVGMVNHICGNDWITIKFFNERNLINEGFLAKQFVGQHLIALNNEAPRLTYWLRESKIANAEVDYVISRGNLILPIEVKAGKSGALKSLQQFVLQKRVDLAIRFDLNMPSLQNLRYTTRTKSGNKSVAFRLLSLPLYLIEELPNIVDQLRLTGNSLHN